MTTSFDQDGKVREALRRVFREHGREGLDQVDVIAPAVPGDSLDERLVRAAAECGVAAMLDARIASGMSLDAALRAVVLHLCARSGLELIGCDWIVYEYALAVGLVSEYPTISGGLPTASGTPKGTPTGTPTGTPNGTTSGTPTEGTSGEKAAEGSSGRVVAPVDKSARSIDFPPAMDEAVQLEEESEPAADLDDFEAARPADTGWTPSAPDAAPPAQSPPVPAGPPTGDWSPPSIQPPVPAGPPTGEWAPPPWQPPTPGDQYGAPGGFPGAPMSPPGGGGHQGYGAPGAPGGYPPAPPPGGYDRPVTPPGGYGAPMGGAPVTDPPGGYPAQPAGPHATPASGYGQAPYAPTGYQPAGAQKGDSSPAQEVVKREMRRGVLAVNAKDRMRQGRKERVEVGIARTNESAPEMIASLTSAPRLSNEVNTADYMQLQLVGDGFAITPLSPPQQLVVPTARWDFDVVPLSGGSQQLSVIGTCWFTVDGQERAMAVPAFVRMVDVEVDNAYRIKRALAGNWQWIIGTILGLGGSIAAWIALFGS